MRIRPFVYRDPQEILRDGLPAADAFGRVADYIEYLKGLDPRSYVAARFLGLEMPALPAGEREAEP